MWLLGIILGANLPIKDLINSIIAFSKESYFIQLYLMLIFLSPMLNTFVEKYNTYLLRYSIIFCSIEFLMEFCFHNKCLYIANGYSLIHFINMYLLGRAAFIKQDKIKCISARWWFIQYFVMVLTIFGSRIFGGGRMVHYAFSYSNPIVICESFFLFFVFGNYNYSVKRTPAIYSKNDWEFWQKNRKRRSLYYSFVKTKTIFTSPDVHIKHLAKPVSYMIPNSLSCFLLMVGLSFTVLIICFIISASEIAPR